MKEKKKEKRITELIQQKRFKYSNLQSLNFRGKLLDSLMRHLWSTSILGYDEYRK